VEEKRILFEAAAGGGQTLFIRNGKPAARACAGGGKLGER